MTMGKGPGLATARGWHRSFCFRMTRFRGTQEQPGLMMVLDRGGQCRGVVYQLPATDLAEQFGRLLRREFKYKPANSIGEPGFRRMEAMAKHRAHSVEFKRQVVQEYLGGETMHGLAKRHDLSRNLIRIWIAKYEAGAFDDDAEAADLLQEYEAKIAALERMVGRQALELEFLKGASASAARPRNALTSVITGPAAFPSPKDAG